MAETILDYNGARYIFKKTCNECGCEKCTLSYHDCPDDVEDFCNQLGGKGYVVSIQEHVQ